MKPVHLWQAKKYATDPVFRAKAMLRSRLTYMLKTNQKTSFGSDLHHALGASYSEVRKHIERQFSAGMSWENYGVIWEIDHVVPLYTATTAEEVHQLFYYMNLQPLVPDANRPGKPHGSVKS